MRPVGDRSGAMCVSSDSGCPAGHLPTGAAHGRCDRQADCLPQREWPLDSGCLPSGRRPLPSDWHGLPPGRPYHSPGRATRTLASAQGRCTRPYTHRGRADRAQPLARRPSRHRPASRLRQQPCSLPFLFEGGAAGNDARGCARPLRPDSCHGGPRHPRRRGLGQPAGDVRRADRSSGPTGCFTSLSATAMATRETITLRHERKRRAWPAISARCCASATTARFRPTTRSCKTRKRRGRSSPTVTAIRTGLAFHPQTGELWESEFGPAGGDELNLLTPGHNYGWPLVSFARNYTGTLVSDQPWWRPGMEMPIFHWNPVLNPSNMIFYTGGKFAQLTNSLIVAGAGTKRIVQLSVNGRFVRPVDSMLRELNVRFRDIRQGPDECLYSFDRGSVAWQSGHRRHVAAD